MLETGDLVTYRSRSGMTAARVVAVIPDIDRTYYALAITSRKHPQHPYGTELLVPVDSDLVVFRRKPKARSAPRDRCSYGHEYTPTNTYYEVGHMREGVRRCRECLRRHKNLWYARKVGKRD